MLVLSFSFSTKLPAMLQHRDLKRNKQKASLILQANLLAKEQNSTPGDRMSDIYAQAKACPNCEGNGVNS